MGTSGTGIFSDDLACDVRAAFRDLIGDGVEPNEATKRILKDFAGSLKDEGTTFWLSLAATQSRMGRLQDDVKQRALQIIDSGADLKEWQERHASKANLRKRDAVLAKLRDELTVPQRNPTKVRKPYYNLTDWEIGHAIAYRLCSGSYIIMRVILITDEGKSRIPIVELCDWIGKEIPDKTVIARLPRRYSKYHEENLRKANEIEDPEDRQSAILWAMLCSKFAIYSLGPRDFPADRVQIVATHVPIEKTAQNPMGISFFGGWKRLDEYLRREYEIE